MGLSKNNKPDNSLLSLSIIIGSICLLLFAVGLVISTDSIEDVPVDYEMRYLPKM
ncbi:MAG: hypothetical protein ABIA04_04750 [Pseudomonadota bacterium]